MAVAVQIAIDCADPARLAEFWALALGYKLQDPPPGFATWPDFLAAQGIPEEEWGSANAVVDPDGVGPRIFFQRVPEPKTVKNRVHLDVNVGGGREVPAAERRRRVDEAVDRLVAAGGRKLGAFEQHGEYWVTMQDPEGNELDLQ
jgi:hypothetical protein